jgi:hypothetical protein
MFDKKQIQNIRNTWFKVSSSKMRSQIAWLAQTLSEEEDEGPKRDAIYWATIWHCSLPENREEFLQMFNELTADGSTLGLQEGETNAAPPLSDTEMTEDDSREF